MKVYDLIKNAIILVFFFLFFFFVFLTVRDRNSNSAIGGNDFFFNEGFFNSGLVCVLRRIIRTVAGYYNKEYIVLRIVNVFLNTHNGILLYCIPFYKRGSIMKIIS